MYRHPGNLPVAARFTLIALLILAAVPVVMAQQRLEPPLRLTAFAVNLGVTPDAKALRWCARFIKSPVQKRRGRWPGGSGPQP